MELLKVRLDSFDKQEARLKGQAEKLQKEIMKGMRDKDG